MRKNLNFINEIKLIDEKKIGFTFFYLGLFLLPSALFFSLIFLLISFLINTFFQRKHLFKDKWNIPFIISGLLMVISTFFHVFIAENFSQDGWDSKLSIIGLSNWLPFFWIFWSAQPYIKSINERKRVAWILISGTFPVLISGICQYFFNLTGPFSILNGLIIWYQRPIEDPAGVSSLFNNANYAGAWLSIVFPFCIASFKDRNNKNIKKNIILIFLILICAGMLLTNSRIAWGNLFISIPFVLGSSSFLYLIPFLFLLFLIIIWTTNPSFTGIVQDQLRTIIPNKMWMEFSKGGFEGQDISRLGIWLSAINFIIKRPFIGFGGASFPILFEIQSGFWKGHTHNLPLEIAVSYGIPASIIIFCTIFILLFLSGRKIYFINYQKTLCVNYYEKAWWTSILLLIISQQVDVHYFDARISICFWILLGGLRNIIAKEDYLNE